MHIRRLLPPILYEYLLDIRSWISYYRQAKLNVISKNDALFFKKSSKEAAIIATGPSIKDIDFNKFNDVDCFSVSNFFLHDDISKLNLKMHFFAPWHEPLDLNNYLAWLARANKILPDNTVMGLGFRDYNKIESNNIFDNRERFYFFLTGRDSARASLKGPILSPQTGPLMILPVLIALGYEKIYLVGCDHDVIKSYGTTVQHFYQSEEDMRKNASCKNSWAGVIDSHASSMNVFVQYQKYLKKYNEVNIYNCSKSGWLDFMEYSPRFSKH